MYGRVAARACSTAKNIVHQLPRANTLASEGRHAGRAPQTQRSVTKRRLAAGRASMVPRKHWAPRHATNLAGPSPKSGGRGAPPPRLRPTHPPARQRLHLVLRREDVPPRKAVESDGRRQQPQQRAGPAKRLRQVLHLRCEHHGFCSPPLGPRAACLTLSLPTAARVRAPSCLCVRTGADIEPCIQSIACIRGATNTSTSKAAQYSRARLIASATRNMRICIRI